MSPAVLAVTAHAANAMALGEEMVQIPIAFEMVAVIVAAASGVLAARETSSTSSAPSASPCLCRWAVA